MFIAVDTCRVAAANCRHHPVRGGLHAPIVAPSLDRYARMEAVHGEVEQGQRVYELLGRQEEVRIETPFDFKRFMEDRQEQVINWPPSNDEPNSSYWPAR